MHVLVLAGALHQLLQEGQIRLIALGLELSHVQELTSRDAPTVIT